MNTAAAANSYLVMAQRAAELREALREAKDAAYRDWRKRARREVGEEDGIALNEAMRGFHSFWASGGEKAAIANINKQLDKKF